jgi:dimethylargininase
MPAHAIVRPPGRSYPLALTAIVPVPPVDLSVALEQHAAYADALRACGLEVIELEPDENHPDAVFVQDPVLIAGGVAVRLRSAAPSRRGEADSLIEVLRAFMPVRNLVAPATLDGGDVLVTEDRLYVGLSTRSNRAGCEQLQALTGMPVVPVALPEGLLHLLSGCTYLGNNRLLTVPALVPCLPGFEPVPVPEAEAAAANVLVIGRHAIVPAGFPRVADLVAACGLLMHAVPSGEFEKRDGGVTCRALIF